jgi:hypothetical protein
MFKATVAQKPTIAVSDGTKNRQSSRPDRNLPGELRTGPIPPASRTTHHSITTPIMSKKGADTFSTSRIKSKPFQTTYTFSAQKTPKQIHNDVSEPPSVGHAMPSIVWIAWPPIHV